VRKRSKRDVAADRFTEFYTVNYRDVVGLVYTLTGSWGTAEDLAQEAFLRAYRDWRRVGDFQRPDSWVRTVAVNLAMSRGRRLAAEARAMLRLRSREPSAVTEELPDDAEEFWRAVRTLPPRQAEATALRYHADLSVNEIAQVMGCAVGTAKAHLHHARRSLAVALGVADEPAAAARDEEVGR
jgi:RNA polymerase sigma factor (sigma-70 family)